MATNSWRVIIADDEPVARRGVRRMLSAYPEFVVAGECRDGKEALAAIESQNPDVVFLDIAMPEMDGFEVIRRRTPERMPAVVFLTAYDQFALEAFDAEAHDYLVKPVSEARFAATMKRLTKRLQQQTPSPREPVIVVTTTRGSLVLQLAEIDWFESADNYSRVWVGARSYLLRQSLSELERRIASHGFARAHRQAMVRLAAVRGLSESDEGEMIATLANGTRVPVSRRRRSAFAAALRGEMSP